MRRLLMIIDAHLPVPLAGQKDAVGLAQAYSRFSGLPFDLAVFSSDATPYMTFGARRIILVPHADPADHTADRLANSVLGLDLKQVTAIAGVSAGLCRDALPIIAGRLGLTMIADVTDIDGNNECIALKASRYGGKVTAKILINQPMKSSKPIVVSAHAGAFSHVKISDKRSTVVEVDSTTVVAGRSSRLVSTVDAVRRRPPLTEADIIVAGGRSLRDGASFDTLICGLADKLGGAPGASGGAVQSGIAPKEMLIGQTGSTVSPDLYIAGGISGVDQHIGGLKKPRITVAINSDPTAPIFQVADYGLVADVHSALPELLEKI